MKLCVFMLLMVGALSASAKAGETALSLYLAGEYSQAETAGLAQNDAQGFAVAARAALADEQIRDEPCLECLRHAEELSRRAIAADPKQPEGHIYLAAAIGYEARVIGEFAAQSKNYANIAKRELDAALAADPKNPWALAALGSWNIEIVRGAGSALGRWLFGARFNTGQEFYERAFAIAPTNLVIHYQYALALAAYDLSANRQEVEDQLTRAASGNAQSKYETFARARAQQLLEAVKRADLSEAHRLVRRDQGYPD